MYQALYRKYRPRSFDDVVGQKHVTETLSRQIETGKFTHAYLFIGTRGTGKTTCARILSRAVNCLNPVNGNPCNKCTSCIGLEDGSILDVAELDAASNNSVDDVRDWRHEVIYSPVTVKKRVYIVDEVHMLSASAFNALLKILEEPPEHMLFILATTELHKVPATIQSRCQKFSFRRLSLPEISARLCEIAASEGLELTDDAASLLARFADGSMRDGISLLDQCVADKEIDVSLVQETLGLASNEELVRMIRAIASHDTVAAMGILDLLYKDGKDMAALLGELSGVLRDLLVVKLAPESGTAQEESILLSSSIARSELAATSELLAPSTLLYCLEVVRTALSNLPRTGASKLIPEMCIIKMSDERLSDDPSALLSRIERLEAGGATVREERNEKQLTEAVNRNVTKTLDVTVAVNDARPVDKEQPTVIVEEASVAETDIPKTAPVIAPPVVATNASGDILQQILGNIKEPAMLALLKKARATRTNNIVTIYVEDMFSANTVRNSDSLKEAVKKTLGQEAIVRVETEQSGSDAAGNSKLDEIAAGFPGIVKFEE